MAKQHAFRFGMSGTAGATTAEEFRAVARKAEDIGFSTLTMGDHVGSGLASLTTLTAAAEATTTLRVGSLVFANDFRHPALLAKEAATLDWLSNGRLDFGLGTGWERSDYESLGLSLDPPGVRISRLEEAIQIIKGLFGPEPVTFAGQYYNVTELNGLPKPVQQPRPPFLIGGGGPRMLSLAAREADIVSIDSTHTKDGKIDYLSVTPEAFVQKAQLIRQAAGTRFPELEINMFVWALTITDDPEQTISQFFEPAKHMFSNLEGVSPAELLESPKLLVGTEDEIVEMLQARRERFGISYYSIWIRSEQDFEMCKPILARLAGK